MHNEQIFTPYNIVNLMLNNIKYTQENDIVNKHIIDNSCGNGAFLCEIVRRYIDHCIKNNINNNIIVSNLEQYIHGIEIDTSLCNETKVNLDNIAHRYGLNNIKWDINNSDVVDCINKYCYKMDYVIGNPPYCKVHDLTKEQKEKYKKFCGNSKGTFDSYIMFFWIGIKMLKRNGELSYITPSSWTNSLYATPLREWLCNNFGVISIIDMKHCKIFDNATTFTMITTIGKWYNNETTPVYIFRSEEELIKINECRLDKYAFGDKSVFYFKDNKTIKRLYNILNQDNISKKFEVKNGFATLKDKLFILDNNEENINSKNIIKCVKASKGLYQNIIFPYNENGLLIDFEYLDKNCQELLFKKAKKLHISTKNVFWYQYGRKQAVNDVFYNKISINNLIKNVEDVKINFCESNVGVYSGFYILSDDNYCNKETISFIQKTLKNKDFVDYVHSLGRYKNGGFSTFTAKELQLYLNYQWCKKIIKINE